jgi:hypothetical protein
VGLIDDGNAEGYDPGEDAGPARVGEYDVGLYGADGLADGHDRRRDELGESGQTAESTIEIGDVVAAPQEMMLSIREKTSHIVDRTSHAAAITLRDVEHPGAPLTFLASHRRLLVVGQRTTTISAA